MNWRKNPTIESTIFILVYLGTFFAIRTTALSSDPVNIDVFLQQNPTWGIAFRETQTFWGVLSVLRNGYSLFDLETPVLGPPFQIPLELPLFQNISAFFCSLFGIDVAFGTRLLALFFFCLTVFIYFNLFKLLYSFQVAILFVIFCTLTPYSLVWSATGLIESFTNLLLSISVYLWYIYIKERKTSHFLVSCCVLSLASMSKITTVFPLALLIFFFLHVKNQQDKRVRISIRSFLKINILLDYFLIATFSLFPGFLWSRFADDIKRQSFFTNWLTSGNLKTWNFGSFEQRITWLSWLAIGGRLYLVFGITLLTIILLFSFKRLTFDIIILMSITAIPILLYFNLYVTHDYYFMALQPLLALLASLTWVSFTTFLTSRWSLALKRSLPWFIILCIASTFVWTPGHDYKTYLRGSRTLDLHYVKSVKVLSKPSDYILMLGCDWNPAPLYLMDRKGLAIPSFLDNVNEALRIVDRKVGLHKFKIFVNCDRSIEVLNPAPAHENYIFTLISNRVYLISNKP
jgi:4-amino-4-deoxy-L-arabinose transferase-like glycosyltransferase